MKKKSIGVCSQQKPEFGGQTCVHLFSGEVIFVPVHRFSIGANVFVRKDGGYYTLAKKSVPGRRCG